MTQRRRIPHLLLILDGWGHREASEHNAIAQANTPTWDRLWESRPHTLIDASGTAVGLPGDQMGNSEVGHMNLGTGRVVYQDLTRINNAIANTDDSHWLHNPALAAAMSSAKASGKQLHLMGLLSPGGVHSHEDHLIALLESAKTFGLQNQVQVHAFLDGRDTPPKSAAASLNKINDFLAQHQLGRIASLCGRFYAMDRDERWERVAKAYQLLTEGHAEFEADTALIGLEQAYQRDETDEFVAPTRIGPADRYHPLSDGDSVIFFNFRSDRARELTKTLIIDDFTGFKRAVRPQLSHFVSLTQYAKDLPTEIAFPPAQFSNTLGGYLSEQGKTQLRIAETEKYAHVTFFFNGGTEQPFKGEKRILVDSPKDVATYDLKPEMSAFDVTEQLTAAINSGEYDALICNLANGDMVGHTGNMQAAIQAAEVIDQCLAQLTAAIEQQNGHCLITADHGNLEMMQAPNSEQPHTAHTSYPVPLIYVGNANVQFNQIKAGTETLGSLCDISPTLLKLMGLEQPKDMTGQALLTSTDSLLTSTD